MARQKVPEAGPRHPARKLLKEKSAVEIASALGISAGNIYPLKSGKTPLNENMANRIMLAFNPGPAAGMKKKALGDPPEPAAPEPGSRRAAHPSNEFVEAEERVRQIERIEGIARDAISRITKDELIPAISRLVERILKEHDPGEIKFPALLVIPLEGVALNDGK